MIDPRRIRIVGASGAGKSYLARQVAERLDLSRLELDAVFWGADWTKRPADEAHAILDRFLAEHPDAWVIDGNWTSSLRGRLEPGTPGGADTIVWLDHSRTTVMRRAVLRALRRGLTREELWHGNREKMSTWLRWTPEENILRWSWVSHPEIRARMLGRIAAGDPIIRLRGQRDVDRWLATLGTPRARDRRRRR